MKFSKKALSIFLLAATLSSSPMLSGASAMFSGTPYLSSKIEVPKNGNLICELFGGEKVSEAFDDLRFPYGRPTGELFRTYRGATAIGADLRFMNILCLDEGIDYDLVATYKLQTEEEFRAMILGCLYDVLKKDATCCGIVGRSKEEFINQLVTKTFKGPIYIKCKETLGEFHVKHWIDRIIPELYKEYKKSMYKGMIDKDYDDYVPYG